MLRIQCKYRCDPTVLKLELGTPILSIVEEDIPI